MCVYMINVHTRTLVYMVNPKLLLLRSISLLLSILCIPPLWWVAPVCVEESDSTYKIKDGFQYDSWQERSSSDMFIVTSQILKRNVLSLEESF